MCVVKDGPDVALFTHPAALTKLALWVGEALAEQERESQGRLSQGGRGTPLVVASLNEKRGIYVVVGTGGGGGPDASFLDGQGARRRRAEREAKARAREEAREARERVREERRAARREAGRDASESEESASESESGPDDDEDNEDGGEGDDAQHDKGYGLNRFGSAFQEVAAETKARVRIDSFEHCVVEVKKEDLGAFLEGLSTKAVVG